MEVNKRIVGIIDISMFYNKNQVLKSISLNKKQKYELFKKSRKFKSDIVVDDRLESYDLLKLHIWNQLYVGNNKVVIIEPTIILNYEEILNLESLLKSLKIKYNVEFIIYSKDTDFLLEISEYIFIKNSDIIIKSGLVQDILFEEQVLIDNKIKVPNMVSVINLACKRYGVKLKHRNNINDLIKDIYRESNKVKK